MRGNSGLWIAAIVASVLLGCEEKTDPESVVQEQAPTTSETTDTSTPEAPVAPAPTTSETPAAELKKVTPDELQGLVDQHKGKVVLFDFWATWCIPCLKQYPHTVELSEKHADDLVVYSVSMDETDEETLAQVKEQLGKWPAGRVTTLINATGADQAAFEGYDITEGALPHYKVYGRDGKLAAALGGTEAVPTEETVDAAVASALDDSR